MRNSVKVLIPGSEGWTYLDELYGKRKHIRLIFAYAASSNQRFVHSIKSVYSIRRNLVVLLILHAN